MLVSIIGFGLMGAQIAQVFSEKGYLVRAYDVSDQQLNSGMDLIRKGRYGIENSIAKGRLSRDQGEEIIARIKTFTSIEKASEGSELIVEAAIENLDTKREIFKKLLEASDNAVLASNTSTILISQITAEFSQIDRKRIVGMHFFNPPQIMKLVEVVRTEDTSEEANLKVSEIARSLGKIPILVMDSPGFVANRIGLAVFAEASSLLQNNVASVRDIDLAMRLGYGYPLGPFELGDLVGLDARLRNMESLYKETNDTRFKPPEILKQLVKEGFIGDPKIKPGSKGGYYEYFKLKKPSEE
ncbi:MAG: 3-hydroxyacyl-CoA dehydrogenase family protein [Nitrososphaerales archaeon]